MKRSIIAAVLAGVFLSGGANAAPAEEQGTLTITGEVTGTACRFDNGKNVSAIELGNVPASAFQGYEVGVDVPFGENEATTPMVLVCDPAKDVIIKVDGAAFDYNDVIENTLDHNSGGAIGVGFKLYHKNKLIEKDGNSTLAISDLKSLGDNKYELLLSARYAKTASSVSEGKVNGTVKLMVIQE